MKTDLENSIEKIKGKVPVLHQLLGLAEECAELSQAALKLVRVFDKKNPTTKSEDEAIEDLYEEAADVVLYLKTLGINQSSIEQTMEYKAARWERRLEATEQC